MLRFQYMARDELGKAASGELVAANRTEAAKLLRAEGKFIVNLTEMAEEKSRKTSVPRGVGPRRVTQDQVIFFANQLSVMVDTGVPLVDALEATIEDEPVGAFRRVVSDVIERVQGGQEFSAVLRKHPRVFPPFFCSIVRASEASGLMGPMLQRAAAYMNNQREIKKRIKEAMAYPLAMIFFAVVVTAGLLTFLIPKFEKIFTQSGKDLPVLTDVLLTISRTFNDHWYWIVSGLAALGFGLWQFLRTAQGRKVTSWLKLKVPILGNMYRKAYVARCLRTMGTMIDAGVSMLDTVGIAREVVGNHYYEQLFSRVDEQLQKGNLLSDSLRSSELFPRAIVQMVLAGEKSGQLGPVMNRVADFCESDLDHAIKTSTQLLAVILVVFMSSFVGTLVIGLLLPIFTLSSSGGGSL